MTEFVPESAIDYDEVFRRGGRIYLMDYEVDTVYLDAGDLSKRTDADPGSLRCLGCGYEFRADEPIIGPKADLKFAVTWSDLSSSPWSWIAGPPAGR